MEKIDIKSMHLEQLQETLAEKKLPKFRAGQIFDWLHVKGVHSFNEMSNLSKELRSVLTAHYVIPDCTITLKRLSALDGTAKYLLRLMDGQFVEAVLMRYHHGNSVCISTQVGCKMGCTFCATGQAGFTRNLLPAEMLGQVLAVQQDIGERLSNIVLMGMGEPLDNYDHVLQFLSLVSHSKGMNIGMRHISLSTCGLVDKIYQLAKEHLQLTLSVSLHAPNDTIRGRTMPISRKWSLESLLTACKHYGTLTGRRISFEYAMIDGVNDSAANATELAERLRGILCHINLIPVNTVTGAGYTESTEKTIRIFTNILCRKGFTATVRRTLGADIEAACGQLKGKQLKEELTHEGIC